MTFVISFLLFGPDASQPGSGNCSHALRFRCVHSDALVFFNHNCWHITFKLELCTYCFLIYPQATLARDFFLFKWDLMLISVKHHYPYNQSSISLCIVTCRDNLGHQGLWDCWERWVKWWEPLHTHSHSRTHALTYSTCVDHWCWYIHKHKGCCVN